MKTKSLILLTAISFIFLIPLYALSAPMIGFSGQVSFDQSTGLLSVDANVSTINDLTNPLISVGDTVSLEATWDSTQNFFIDGQFSIASDTDSLVLADADPLIFSGFFIFGAGLSGPMTITSGELQPYLSTSVDFSSMITPDLPFPEDYLSTDFTGTISGNILSGEVPSEVPIPAAWSLLGLGLMTLLGLRKYSIAGE